MKRVKFLIFLLPTIFLFALAQPVLAETISPTPSPSPSPMVSPSPTPTEEEETPPPTPEESPSPSPEAEKGRILGLFSTGQAVIAGLILLALIGSGITFAAYARKKPKKKEEEKPEPEEKEETS